MAHIPIPRKSTIERHFKDAQEIVDLKSKATVDIGLRSAPSFESGAWYFGQIMVWQNGKYAQVTKCKPGACVGCKNKKK